MDQPQGAIPHSSLESRMPSGYFRTRHAEEVRLPSEHSAEATLTSTTGRHVRPAPSSSNNGPTPSSSPAVLDCTDMFGFRVSAAEKAAEQEYSTWRAYTTKEMNEWRRAIPAWTEVSEEKKKSLCRRGVPPALRSTVWLLLLGTYLGDVQGGDGDVVGPLPARNARAERAKRRALYDTWRSAPLPSSDVDGIIERDLPRTFPTHALFNQKDGQGMLRNILHAYANANPIVGYCQGMAFVAGTLLIQLESEEEAFWAFKAMMEQPRWDLQNMFVSGFPKLYSTLYVMDALMEKELPALHRQLRQQSIELSFFAPQWFLTVFSYNLNFVLVMRIWDMFLCEGWKPVYRIALALLQMDERRLLREPEMILALKQVEEGKDPNTLLRVAQDISFRTATVQRLLRKYEKTRT